MGKLENSDAAGRRRSEEDKCRTKRKKRKKDLEELHRKVLKAKQTLRKKTDLQNGQTSFLKVLNKFANKRQENDNKTQGICGKTGKKVGPRKISSRLLPKPVLAGIFKNVAQGKHIKRNDGQQNNLNQPENEKNMFKLLDGNASKSKDAVAEKIFDEILKHSSTTAANESEATPNGQKPSPILGKAQGPLRKPFEKEKEEETVLKSLGLQKVTGDNGESNSNTMICIQKEDKCKRRLFQNEAEDVADAQQKQPSETRIATKVGEIIISADKSMFENSMKDTSIENKVMKFKSYCWSPLTRYDELCSVICRENFEDDNFPGENSPDPLVTVKETLRGTYADTFRQQFLREKAHIRLHNTNTNVHNSNGANAFSASGDSHFSKMEVQACTYSKDSEFFTDLRSSEYTIDSRNFNCNNDHRQNEVLFSPITKDGTSKENEAAATSHVLRKRDVLFSPNSTNVRTSPTQRPDARISDEDNLLQSAEDDLLSMKVNHDPASAKIYMQNSYLDGDLLSRYLNDVKNPMNQQTELSDNSCCRTSPKKNYQKPQIIDIVKWKRPSHLLNNKVHKNQIGDSKQQEVKASKHIPAILRRSHNANEKSDLNLFDKVEARGSKDITSIALSNNSILLPGTSEYTCPPTVKTPSVVNMLARQSNFEFTLKAEKHKRNQPHLKEVAATPNQFEHCPRIVPQYANVKARGRKTVMFAKRNLDAKRVNDIADTCDEMQRHIFNRPAENHKPNGTNPIEEYERFAKHNRPNVCINTMQHSFQDIRVLPCRKQQQCPRNFDSQDRNFFFYDTTNISVKDLNAQQNVQSSQRRYTDNNDTLFNTANRRINNQYGQEITHNQYGQEPSKDNRLYLVTLDEYNKLRNIPERQYGAQKPGIAEAQNVRTVYEDLPDVGILNGVQNLRILPTQKDHPRACFSQPTSEGPMNNGSTVVVQAANQPVKYLAFENGKTVQRVPVYAPPNVNRSTVALSGVPTEMFTMVQGSKPIPQEYVKYIPVKDLQTHSRPFNERNGGQFANVSFLEYPESRSTAFRPEETNAVYPSVQFRVENESVKPQCGSNNNFQGVSYLQQMPRSHFAVTERNPQRNFVEPRSNHGFCDFQYQANSEEMIRCSEPELPPRRYGFLVPKDRGLSESVHIEGNRNTQQATYDEIHRIVQ